MLNEPLWIEFPSNTSKITTVLLCKLVSLKQNCHFYFNGLLYVLCITFIRDEHYHLCDYTVCSYLFVFYDGTILEREIFPAFFSIPALTWLHFILFYTCYANHCWIAVFAQNIEGCRTETGFYFNLVKSLDANQSMANDWSHTMCDRV